MSFWLYLRDGTLCVTGQCSGYALHYLRVTRKIWHYNTLWMISICNGTCLTNIYTVIEPLVWHFKNPTCSICILVAYIGALAYIYVGLLSFVVQIYDIWRTYVWFYDIYIYTIWYSECIHIHRILCKYMDSRVLSTCGHGSGTSQLCTSIVGCPCQNWQLCMPEPTVAWWPLS